MSTGNAALEQGADVVGRGHLHEAARRGQSGVAVAGGDVEHALAGTQVDRLGLWLRVNDPRPTHSRLCVRR